MQNINWGIIGCGNVTERKSGPAFNKIEGSRILAVMRRDTEKARDYALRHQIPHWTGNADDIIQNREINAVYIATPPSSHADFAIRVMESGKIAYVEKPMALNYEECIRMVRVAEKTGQPLYVAYYRRHLPYFKKVNEIIRSGELGKLLYARIDFHIPPRKEDFNKQHLPWRVKPEIAGAGYFYDLACHQLDLFEWIFGDIDRVTGSVFNRMHLYDAEDVVFASLTYKSGLPVTACWCFAAGNNEHTDLITIHGSEGSLSFSTFDFTPIKLESIKGSKSFQPENPENIQYWLIRNMIEELQSGHQPSGNAKTAMKANQTMDLILGKLPS